MRSGTSPQRPILVVDDDADVIAIARRVLEHGGWTVVGSTDPREALEMAVALEPCLVIFDLMMPHMDGEEFFHAVRERLRGRVQPRFALISAAYARGEVARRLEVDASIAKPFELEDLRDLAARFASQHRAGPSSSPPASA